MLWFCFVGRYEHQIMIIFSLSAIFSSPAYCLVIKFPKDLQNALGGLSQVIFNPNRRGGLGIVVLVPGRTTPASLAQFEQLALTYACCLL